MRTATLEIFTYDELDKAAQAKARDWFRSIDTDNPWVEENIDSLKAFLDHVGATLDSYAYGGSWCRGNHVKISIHDTDIAALSGVRLWKYLQNNDLTTYNGTPYNQCPMTGYCMDATCGDELDAFMVKPDSREFEELIQDCANAWLKACVADIDYQNTDEAVTETIIANDYEFTGDGSRYA